MNLKFEMLQYTIHWYINHFIYIFRYVLYRSYDIGTMSFF